MTTTSPLNHALELLRAELTLNLPQLDAIAGDFSLAMDAGLRKEPSSLRMLPSYIGLPNGDEKGRALAIDFGGTNVRVMQAELAGSRKASILSVERFPLVDPKAGYDLISSRSTGAELFDHFARWLARVAGQGEELPLGFTFSFPCEQTGILQARLLYWTKEIQTRDVVDRDLGELLLAALGRASLVGIKPAAIINDTVGTLLASSYSEGGVDIGAICGTGHNACYLEPVHPLTGAPMVVNIESGNFDRVPQTRFDVQLDRTSTNPGAQRLEKMVSGKYLGELLRRVLLEWSQDGLLPPSTALAVPDTLSGRVLDTILLDGGAFEATDKLARNELGMPSLDLEQRIAIHTAMRLLADRSARVAGASFVGIVRHCDPQLSQPHGVAVDGSLYEKMPGFAAELQRTIDSLLQGAKHRVTTRLAKDGSGIGAAIAGRVASN